MRDDGILEACVEQALERIGPHLVMGLPLGLGKPNPLVNAFYRRAKRDSRIRLDIVTALSLDLPVPRKGLEARFLQPFLDRHFGAQYPRLEYVRDLDARRLPDNVSISEFYLRSGSQLGNPLAQRRYISSNYTHVARDLVDRGVNLTLQLVAEGESEGRRCYSLSCNPDVGLDLKQLVRTAGRDCMFVAQVHPELPFMHGDAMVDADFFDLILPATGDYRLFAVPRAPVSLQEHWVGLHASSLVADGGTLQIGIGSLSDALVHALILRQRDNTTYCGLLANGCALPRAIGGFSPFRHGLYGASEMFMDGFMHLYRAGILRREVFDDEALQAHADAGTLSDGLRGTGAIMDAAFFLGSCEFYAFLNALGPAERPRFRMTSVGRVNQLYGGREQLETVQRRRARFINTCMMVTVTGAAVSDGLENHQVVSGVGGQYNFVAMAHAMADGRSILMLRSTRGSGKRLQSNIVWEYPHTTIPRHLRDIVVTEYGIADLRGRTDEECIQALLGIADARFQQPLLAQAKACGKVATEWSLPLHARGNLPARLSARRRSDAAAASFPTYPFGSDFTPLEDELATALRALKTARQHWLRLALGVMRARPRAFPEALARMGLESPRGWRERLQARLIAHALARG
jgi:acyl-CoA hydrolase